ncbi:hypothetical protein EDD17DRAFT_307315 [Pisolithus thermaeus]|nr:hypothetical protein EDD17DRAFT_307315 [Pisolithus thermaeus]
MQGQRYCSCAKATFRTCIVHCFCGAGPHVNESIMIPRDTFDVASFSVLCSEASLSLPFPSEVRQLHCGRCRASTMWGSCSACRMSFDACADLVACWGGHEGDLMRSLVATWDNRNVHSANVRYVVKYARFAGTVLAITVLGYELDNWKSNRHLLFLPVDEGTVTPHQ